MIGVNELLFLICGITFVCSLLLLVWTISKNWWVRHENTWRKRYNSAVRHTLNKEDDNKNEGR